MIYLNTWPQRARRFPPFLHRITDASLGGATLVFDPDAFDFEAWVRRFFGAEYRAEVRELEARAAQNEWSAEYLEELVEDLQASWFNPDSYEGEILKQVKDNIYAGKVYWTFAGCRPRHYRVTPVDNGSYRCCEID